ncbi:hypothetical protein ACGFXC_30055 [Streptomyces sp. NPDC048507]|uniref:hypothetical protein n=1 Tax=Streptomyces sp. NPDC048507 TaxID=3365560 RepID=UPI0037171D36
MDVHIEDLIRERAARLGAGVPYALKVLTGQLAEDPDMGEPLPLPLGRTVRIDGDTFEDCPALIVDYIREPDRVQILGVKPARPEAPAGHGREQGQGHRGRNPVPVDEAVVARQIADAWTRIAACLAARAPASYAALRPGVREEAVEAFGWGLGVRVPAELRSLWRLVAGDDGVDGAGCLPGKMSLMPLQDVGTFHRARMKDPVGQLDGEELTSWKASWIPLISLGPADHTSGLYLDTESGFLGPWSRYADTHVEERDTLVTYLEEMADMLQSPALATRDQPGTVGGALIWRSSLPPADEQTWTPLTD